MADTDPLTLFPTTTPSTAPPASGGDKDDPLKLFPTTTASATKPPPPPPLPNVSEYGDLGNAWWNTQAQPPPGQGPTPFSLEALRDKIQQGDINVLNYLKPGADESAWTRYPKMAAMLGEHTLAGLAQLPVNALIGITKDYPQFDDQGNLVVPGATINPSGSLGATPESIQAATVGATPLRFGERSPVPVGTFDRPVVSGVNPLDPAVATAAQTRAATGATPPESTPLPPGFVSPPAAAPPTSGGGPSPGSGGPAPSSVGAAGTPRAMSGMTPEQAAAYGSTADKQWLFSSQQPGVTDATEYFPGDTPTLAEREQTVQAARDQKTQRNISPAADQAEREFLHDRSEQRKAVFQQTAGSDATQDAAITEANNNISNGLAAAWRAGGQVDPQPIADAIAAEGQTSGGKLPPVKAAMKDVSDALQKDDGSGMETDPQQVYAVRRVINYLQSGVGKQANPGYGSADVQAALTRVKGAIDTAMEPAAPGFGQAIGDYATAQRAIEAREFLQAEEPKLYDSQGNMNYNKMHNFMQRVVTMRDPRMPPNPAQSLTDAQMDTLKGLHDSLRRSASAADLAKARGSDTAQNLMDIARQAVSGVGGDVAAAVIGGLSHGPAGAIIGPMVKRGVGDLLTARGQAQATQRMQNLLYPDPTRYPTTPNPLQQP